MFAFTSHRSQHARNLCIKPASNLGHGDGQSPGLTVGNSNNSAVVVQGSM